MKQRYKYNVDDLVWSARERYLRICIQKAHDADNAHNPNEMNVNASDAPDLDDEKGETDTTNNP